MWNSLPNKIGLAVLPSVSEAAPCLGWPWLQVPYMTRDVNNVLTFVWQSQPSKFCH